MERERKPQERRKERKKEKKKIKKKEKENQKKEAQEAQKEENLKEGILKKGKKIKAGQKNEKKIEIKIEKNTKIHKLLEKYPQISEFLFNKGLFCFSCPMAAIETIEELCEAYGFEFENFKKEIEDFLKKKIK